MSEAKRVVFLDRDGTINIDHGYVHRVDDWEFISRVPEALKMLNDSGYHLAIVSNQSGIADGKFGNNDVDVLHAHMLRQLEDYGVAIDAIAYCPHHRSGGCECRKPKIGMASLIEDQLGAIDYKNSWVVGDKESDIGFGKGIGAMTGLIRSRYWKKETLKERPDGIYDSLYEFALSL